MNLYDLHPEEKNILKCILHYRNPTAKDILTVLYQSDDLKKWHLYRKLQRLQESKFIQSHRLEDVRGASSPNYFTLRAKGARALGLDKVPPSHYRHIRKDFYLYRQVRINLLMLAEKYQWKVFEDEADCRGILAQFLKYAAQKQHKTVAPDYVYVDSVPVKVTPELVLVTSQEAFVVIIAYPSAGADAFRKKIEKYKQIVYDVRFLCLNSFDEQAKIFKKVLVQQDNEQQSNFTSRFLVLSSNQLEIIHSWINHRRE